MPEVMDAIFYKRGNIRWQVAVIKSLASALSIGTGAAVGREGPIIQIGAALGSAFSQRAQPVDAAKDHAALRRRRRRHRRDLQHPARRRAVRDGNPAAGSLQPHLPAGGPRDRRGDADRPHADRPRPGLPRAGVRFPRAQAFSARRRWLLSRSARCAASPPGRSFACWSGWRTAFPKFPAAPMCRTSSA